MQSVLAVVLIGRSKRAHGNWSQRHGILPGHHTNGIPVPRRHRRKAQTLRYDCRRGRADCLSRHPTRHAHRCSGPCQPRLRRRLARLAVSTGLPVSFGSSTETRGLTLAPFGIVPRVRAEILCSLQLMQVLLLCIEFNFHCAVSNYCIYWRGVAVDALRSCVGIREVGACCEIINRCSGRGYSRSRVLFIPHHFDAAADSRSAQFGNRYALVGLLLESDGDLYIHRHVREIPSRSLHGSLRHVWPARDHRCATWNGRRGTPRTHLARHDVHDSERRRIEWGRPVGFSIRVDELLHVGWYEILHPQEVRHSCSNSLGFSKKRDGLWSEGRRSLQRYCSHSSGSSGSSECGRWGTLLPTRHLHHDQFHDRQ